MTQGDYETGKKGPFDQVKDTGVKFHNNMKLG